MSGESSDVDSMSGAESDVDQPRSRNQATTAASAVATVAASEAAAHNSRIAPIMFAKPPTTVPSALPDVDWDSEQESANEDEADDRTPRCGRNTLTSSKASCRYQRTSADSGHYFQFWTRKLQSHVGSL